MVDSGKWIEESFPPLQDGDYSVTSEPNPEYNCVAWAMGESDRWWSHTQGYYWPDANRTDDVEGLVTILSRLGYETCESVALEDGYDKIAIFEISGAWTHAARQLPNGRWTSKLGVNEDIEHPKPDSLAGSFYGTVHCIMRKKRS